MGSHDALAAVWRWFVAEQASGYSPLYAAIVEAAADDDDLLALVASAPEASHFPLMMLAAVHDLVLAGALPELAAVYGGGGPVTAAPPLFRAAVLDHRDEVLTMLRDRSIQTNECGRAPAIALGLAAVTAAMGRPEALVDAGASAGLNLLYDCYRLDLGEAGVWGDPRSPVVCGCEVRGGLPSSLRFIDVPVRIGLDRAPVDVTDPVAARWLLACTWPDTGRLERLRAALAIAGASPPDVRAGDLVTGIGPLLDGIDGDGLVCVVTSWVLSWLAVDQREAFLEALVAAGSRRPIAWLSLDVAGTVPGIDAENSPTSTLTGAPCLIGLTTFGPAGVESQRPLAHVHPHGVAVQWIGATD